MTHYCPSCGHRQPDYFCQCPECGSNKCNVEMTPEEIADEKRRTVREYLGAYYKGGPHLYLKSGREVENTGDFVPADYFPEEEAKIRDDFILSYHSVIMPKWWGYPGGADAYWKDVEKGV